MSDPAVTYTIGLLIGLSIVVVIFGCSAIDRLSAIRDELAKVNAEIAAAKKRLPEDTPTFYEDEEYDQP